MYHVILISLRRLLYTLGLLQDCFVWFKMIFTGFVTILSFSGANWSVIVNIYSPFCIWLFLILYFVISRVRYVLGQSDYSGTPASSPPFHLYVHKSLFSCLPELLLQGILAIPRTYYWESHYLRISFETIVLNFEDWVGKKVTDSKIS